MTNYLIGVVLLALLSYGGIKAWPLIQGPTLSIDSPENYASITGGIVSIKGKASRGASLVLNNAPILHEEDGSFLLTLTFPRGGSILTFAATDRFGRTIATTLNIFVP